MISMHREVKVAGHPLDFQPAMYVAALMLVNCSIHCSIFLQMIPLDNRKQLELFMPLTYVNQ